MRQQAVDLAKPVEVSDGKACLGDRETKVPEVRLSGDRHHSARRTRAGLSVLN